MNIHNVDHTSENEDGQKAPEVAATTPPNQDLVGIITTMLSEAGHTRPTDWTRYLHPNAYDLNLTDDVRRFLVNRALRMALADAPVPTLDERYCLVDMGDIGRWLELVKSEVVPCMTKYDLPRTAS